MKVIIVALAFVAIAAAAPAGPAPEAVLHLEPIKILRSEFDQQPEGAYVFSFDTENGIHRDENGEVKEILDEENKPHIVVIVRGSYSYPNEKGEPETVNYYADQTGYHAEGASIPKAAARR